MTKQKVLIPLDGSRFSRHILSQVIRLCNPSHQSLILLRVEEELEAVIAAPPHMLPVNGMFVQAYTSHIDADRARHPIYINQVEDSTSATLACELDDDAHMLRLTGFDVSCIVRFGDPAQEIIDAASQLRVDLIAMATHGRSGVQRMILGSVATRVLRRAPVPVMLLRPFASDAKEKLLRSII